MLRHGKTVHGEPNHRQQLALDRIELAVDELASVLLSNCRSNELATATMQKVRQLLGPIIAEVLAHDC